MISPGREHDLRMLQERLDSASTSADKEKWSRKIQLIHEESNHPDIMSMRHHLIEATKRGDTAQIEQISNDLHNVAEGKGTSSKAGH